MVLSIEALKIVSIQNQNGGGETPHNPLGLVFDQSAWITLSEILADTDILVLSDEVYEHMVFDDSEHISVLQIPDLAHRAVAVSSFGKTFHATGWKLGYITAPEHLTQEIRKVYQFLAFAANTPMQIAAAEFLTSYPNYEESVSVLMQGKRDLFVNASMPPSDAKGAYFQIADYSDISDIPDQAFAVHLIETIGVATIPVSALSEPTPRATLASVLLRENDETVEKRKCYVSSKYLFGSNRLNCKIRGQSRQIAGHKGQRSVLCGSPECLVLIYRIRSCGQKALTVKRFSG
jgi:methionine aminotransferase